MQLEDPYEELFIDLLFMIGRLSSKVSTGGDRQEIIIWYNMV